MNDQITDLNRDMPKAYDPQTVEKRLYDWWEAAGYFKPTDAEPGRKRQGLRDLHAAAQRDRRAAPGPRHHGHHGRPDDPLASHAAASPRCGCPAATMPRIAVHYVIDKALASRAPFMDDLLRSRSASRCRRTSSPMTRDDLGREQFMKLGWAWRAALRQLHHRAAPPPGRIVRLGARALHPGRAALPRRARRPLCSLYNKGWIYKGKRLINWCPELPHLRQRPGGGARGHQRPPVDGALPPGGREPDEYISVATTRPETILGDTAVAVNPSDKRYTALVGRIAILPVLGRRIPIIADDAVDPAFGTGAVKVTPGHDPTDYEIGQRHNLAADQRAQPGRHDERERRALRRAGPLRGAARSSWSSWRTRACWSRSRTTATPWATASAADDIIEPLVSRAVVRAKQTCSPSPALEAVQDGRIRIIPSASPRSTITGWRTSATGTSRASSGGDTASRPGTATPAASMTVTAEETLAACPKCGSTNIRQDPDVLDTWFSSALWPFSTLGWPDADRGSEAVLPHQRAGDGLRHPVLLGGAHDHDGAGVHRRHPLRHRVSARHDPRRAGRQDEQDQGQRHQPARGHGRVRHRRPALRPGHRLDARQRHEAVHDAGWRPAATSPTRCGTPRASSSSRRPGTMVGSRAGRDRDPGRPWPTAGFSAATTACARTWTG